MKSYDVVGIGAYCIDFLAVMDGYPSEDQKHEVPDMFMEGGGNAATGCVTVARLGGRVAYHGAIAMDFLTEPVLDGFRREGVDTEWIEMKEGATPFSFIIINKSANTRTIMFRKKGVPPFKKDDVNEELIRSTEVLFIDFYHPEASLKASEIASKNGIPVVLDAESIPRLADEIIENVSHLISSRDFAIRYTGLSEDAEDEGLLEELIVKVKCDVVGITLGERGSVFYDKDSEEIIRQDAFKVDVLDTTGAGDVFHGAFSFFLAKGYSLADIVRYSSACASLSCRRIGGRAGVPSYDELISFLDSTA